jgi:hypothetical protein
MRTGMKPERRMSGVAAGGRRGIARLEREAAALQTDKPRDRKEKSCVN